MPLRSRSGAQKLLARLERALRKQNLEVPSSTRLLGVFLHIEEKYNFFKECCVKRHLSYFYHKKVTDVLRVRLSRFFLF